MTDSRQPADPPEGPRFLGVPETARILGVSPMTLYRAIAANEFPAIRIRNRLIVPATYVDTITRAAIDSNGTVDPAGLVATMKSS